LATDPGFIQAARIHGAVSLWVSLKQRAKRLTQDLGDHFAANDGTDRRALFPGCAIEDSHRTRRLTPDREWKRGDKSSACAVQGGGKESHNRRSYTLQLRGCVLRGKGLLPSKINYFPIRPTMNGVSSSGCRGRNGKRVPTENTQVTHSKSRERKVRPLQLVMQLMGTDLVRLGIRLFSSLNKRPKMNGLERTPCLPADPQQSLHVLHRVHFLDTRRVHILEPGCAQPLRAQIRVVACIQKVSP